MGDKAKRGRPPVATPPIHSNHSIGILDRREMAARCHPLVPGSSVCTHTPSGVRSSQLSRSEEHTSEIQSLMRISYAVFCLQTKIKQLYIIYHLTLHYNYHNKRISQL